MALNLSRNMLTRGPEGLSTQRQSKKRTIWCPKIITLDNRLFCILRNFISFFLDSLVFFGLFRVYQHSEDQTLHVPLSTLPEKTTNQTDLRSRLAMKKQSSRSATIRTPSHSFPRIS